jgi:hypothetical protein
MIWRWYWGLGLSWHVLHVAIVLFAVALASHLQAPPPH